MRQNANKRLKSSLQICRSTHLNSLVCEHLSIQLHTITASMDQPYYVWWISMNGRLVSNSRILILLITLIIITNVECTIVHYSCKAEFNYNKEHSFLKAHRGKEWYIKRIFLTKMWYKSFGPWIWLKLQEIFFYMRISRNVK